MSAFQEVTRRSTEPTDKIKRAREFFKPALSTPTLEKSQEQQDIEDGYEIPIPTLEWKTMGKDHCPFRPGETSHALIADKMWYRRHLKTYKVRSGKDIQYARVSRALGSLSGTSWVNTLSVMYMNLVIEIWHEGRKFGVRCRGFAEARGDCDRS